MLLSLVYTPDVSIKGYIPISGTIDTNMILNQKSGEIRKISDDQLTILNKITRICKENEVDLWILISPIYKQTEEDIRINQDIRDFAKQNCIHFIDFTENIVFSDPLLFKDNLHLNSHGAIEYSKIVGDSLRCSIRNAYY